MALPEKIIDELSREKPNTPGWSWKIFMFSIFILVTVLSFYFGLNFGFKPYLNSKINKLENESKQLALSIPQTDQNKLVMFYSQVANSYNLFKNKKNISFIFQWLERNTISDITFIKFNFNSLSNQLSLGGFSNSRESVLNQILVFQRSPEISSVVLNNLNFSNDKWQFDLIILFRSSIFGNNY